MTSLTSTRTPPVLTLLALPSSTTPLVTTRTPPVLSLLPLPSSMANTDSTLDMDEDTNGSSDTSPSKWGASQLAPIIVTSVICVVVIVALVVRLWMLHRRHGTGTPGHRRRRTSIYDDSRCWTPPPSNELDGEDTLNTTTTSTTKLGTPSTFTLPAKPHSHSSSSSAKFDEIQLGAMASIRHVPASGITASPTWQTVSTVQGVDEKKKKG